MEINEIFITDEAFEMLAGAVEQAKAEGYRELGGSVLAHEHEGSALVAYILPTGPLADRGPSHLLTDAEFQNELIGRILQHRPELRYVGDWHVHTSWLPELSGIDRRTARAILLDEGEQRDHLILLLATAHPQGQAVILGFIARLSRQGTVRIAKVPLSRVPGSSKQVIDRLGRALPALDKLLTEAPEPEIRAAYGVDPSHDLPTLRIIEDDLAEIREKLDAETSVWRDEDLFTAVIRRDDREAFVLFPPEYPLGAPQIFACTVGDETVSAVKLRFGWSSLHRLADPVAEALSLRTNREGHRRSQNVGRAAQWASAVCAFFGFYGLARILERPTEALS